MRIARTQRSLPNLLCVLTMMTAVIAQDADKKEDAKPAARPAARAARAAQVIAAEAAQQVLQKAQIRGKAIAIAPNGALAIGRAAPAPQADPIEAQRKAFTQELEVRIDELDRVCDLEEAQTRKLRLAARGAVDSSMKEWKKRAREYADRIGGRLVNRAGAVAAARLVPAQRVPPARKDPAADTEEKPEDPDDKIRQLPASVFRSVASMVAPVQQNRIWVHTVANTLKPEQRLKYDEAVKARATFLREYRVRQRVIELDSKLVFTPEQREAVFEIVDSVLGAGFSYETPANSRSTVLYGELAGLEPAHLKDVLTANQLQYFTSQIYAVQNDGRTLASATTARMRLIPLPNFANRNVTVGAAFQPVPVFPVVPNAPRQMNVAVHQITPGSPAAKAGLKRGDVVKEIGGDVFGSITVLADIYRRAPGDELLLKVERDGKDVDVTITLEAVR